MRRVFIDFESGPGRMLAGSPHSWMLFLPGAMLVLLGIVVWVMPQVLVALIAGGLIAAGCLMLLVAWRMRQMARG